jgi:hypothetical protein
MTGVSASTGRPFSPPTTFCAIPSFNPRKTFHPGPASEVSQMPQCIAIEGMKDMENKVNIIILFSPRIY